MNKIIWNSITEYVNLLTGEILLKTDIKNKRYRIVKSEQVTTYEHLNYLTHATKKIINWCEPQEYQARLFD